MIVYRMLLRTDAVSKYDEFYNCNIDLKLRVVGVTPVRPLLYNYFSVTGFRTAKLSLK